MSDISVLPEKIHQNPVTGKFLKGNKAAGGMNFQEDIKKIKKLFTQGISLKEWKAIRDKLVEMAKNGNLEATKILLDRVLGKPLQTIESVQLEPLFNIQDKVKQKLENIKE